MFLDLCIKIINTAQTNEQLMIDFEQLNMALTPLTVFATASIHLGSSNVEKRRKHE